jgi:hypothetical protein
MGGLNSKCEVLTLNGQGGKTRRIQEMIKEEELAQPGQHINILVQANNRSLVEQTSVRMDDALFDDEGEADAKIEGHCFSWYSGNGPKVTVDDLVGKIMTPDGVSMIVCCANRKRLDYLSEVIKKVEAIFKRFHSPMKMNIWIDEADASVCFWRDANYQDIMKKEIIEKVVMVTATVDALVKEFKTIRVMPLEEPTLPIYFRVQDYVIDLKEEQKMSALDFLKMAVEATPDRYLSPGVRTFAPGEVVRRSHEAIASYAVSMGAAAIVLNGLYKEIRIPAGEGIAPIIITLKGASETAEEIGRCIGRLYAEHNLERFPLFVTGNMCLGRGITFQNDMFLFDHQILPAAFETRAAAYQAACRGAGNIKKLPNFLAREATGFKPTIVATASMWRWIVEAETIASTLAKKSFGGKATFDIQDLKIASGSEEGLSLECSHVPLRFPLPAELRDIDQRTHDVETWKNTVLECLKTLAPAVHADIVANYPEGHVNNYRMSASVSRYNSMFRPFYQSAIKKERARVNYAWANSRGNNIWQAAIDHGVAPGHLVIGRWQGRRIPE